MSTAGFRPLALLSAALLALAGATAPAHAQTLGYGDPAGDDTGASGGSDEGVSTPARGGRGGHVLRGAGSGARTTIRPYVELTQQVFARLEPREDVVTYTSVAAGVDMSLAGRRTEGAVSVRYERRFVESGNASDSDTVSGLARVRHELIPRELTLEAGGLAARTRVEANGSGALNALPSRDAVSQVWSVYGGPALATHAGDVALNASYIAGYTKVTQRDAYRPVSTAPLVDIFDHSVAQSAQASAGVRPGDVLPVGISASAGYAQEDISNLDQRVRELRAGVQVTVPVTMEVALIGDVGWQDVEVTSRDAVRDSAGRPVIGSDGRYRTDHSAPRRIAYDTSGFTWDVGVMWRPSRRTSLSAFVGRRYDSITYYGSLSYAPDARSALTVNVFDGISGFGGTVSKAVQDLPTDFTVNRNPFSGDISGCAIGARSGGCVNGALSSLSSSVFRARGVSATYGFAVGRLSAGVGFGYTRRRFIGARGTVLEAANGTVDESLFLDAGLSGPIDRVSSFSLGVYDAWYRSGRSRLADTNALGATASYSRQLAERLTGTAALGIDRIDRKVVYDDLIASGLVGLRYSF